MISLRFWSFIQCRPTTTYQTYHIISVNEYQYCMCFFWRNGSIHVVFRSKALELLCNEECAMIYSRSKLFLHTCTCQTRLWRCSQNLFHGFSWHINDYRLIDAFRPTCFLRNCSSQWTFGDDFWPNTSADLARVIPLPRALRWEALAFLFS